MKLPAESSRKDFNVRRRANDLVQALLIVRSMHERAKLHEIEHEGSNCLLFLVNKKVVAYSLPRTKESFFYVNIRLS